MTDETVAGGAHLHSLLASGDDACTRRDHARLAGEARLLALSVAATEHLRLLDVARLADAASDLAFERWCECSPPLRRTFDFVAPPVHRD
jgi:hypothetical protein